MRSWKVGIIGGGPGGLMTAYQLQKIADSAFRVTLFEASERTGGKIATHRFEKIPAKYEAGAAELYDYSPVGEDQLLELVTELGLTVNPMGGSAVIVDDQVLGNLDDVHDRLGPQAHRDLLAFDRMARGSMSPREFFNADRFHVASVLLPGQRFDAVLGGIGEPPARQFVETLIHSDLATEPEKTSVSYGLQNYLMNHPAYMKLYSIDGGNERLPQELVRRIRAELLLEHQVGAVSRLADGKLRVASTHRGQQRDDDFDFVVVALPHNALCSVDFRGERLGEAMRAHHAHYHHPAHYLRVTILFDRPFWRSSLPESYSMHDAFGGCCLYDESSREPQSSHGVLGWLLGGQVASDMSSLGDDELISRALDSLPEFLAHGRAHFIEGRAHRWIDSVNAMPGGTTPRSLDRRHQPEPIEHPRLFMVGDYLFDSTLNGVLDSADYVSHWIAAIMAEERGTTS